jgi:methyl-accepting chemotaxis protein
VSFHEHGVPSYAVAICHAVVSGAIIADLGLNRPATRRFSRIGSSEAERASLRAAIEKAAWLDLELLLETYDAVQHEARLQAAEELEAFDARIRSVLGAVGAATTEVEGSVQLVAASVERTSRQVAAVASASDQASVNVQTVAGAAEELSASIGEVSAQVAKAAGIARDANEAAQRTDATVQGLAASAQKIGDVVSLIHSIAGQTNLLALNATIEAARAGDAGKGFAVVASEVKSLDNQTAKATEEISAQITAMQGVTREAVEAIRSIGQVIGDMDRVAAAIAAAVEQQRASTQEIAGNVHKAAIGTQDVASNIAGVNDAAQESGAAAGQVLGVVRTLAQQAQALQAAVDELVARGRSARREAA